MKRAPTYRSRRDGNHEERVSDFLAMGCTVIDTHAVGIAGFPDIVVGACGLNHLVEVKDRATAYGRAGLNPQQAAFQRGWNGGPIYEVACTDDVIDLVNIWRQKYARA